MTEYTCILEKNRKSGYKKLMIVAASLDKEQVNEIYNNEYFEVADVFYTDHIEFYI